MVTGICGSSIYFVDGETGGVLRDIEMEREGCQGAEKYVEAELTARGEATRLIGRQHGVLL